MMSDFSVLLGSPNIYKNVGLNILYTVDPLINGHIETMSIFPFIERLSSIWRLKCTKCSPLNSQLRGTIYR